MGGKDGKVGSEPDAKARRLAEALRQNLRRRKAQARARAAGSGSAGSEAAGRDERHDKDKG